MSAVFLALLLLASCAPLAPTSYHSEDSAGYGYRSLQTGEHSFVVTFTGNRATPREVVEAGMLYRAAELAQERGYDEFALMERSLHIHEREEQFYSPPYPYRPGYHDRHGYYPYFPPHYRHELRYRALGTVVLFRGDPPERAAGLYKTAEVLRARRDDLRFPKESATE